MASTTPGVATGLFDKADSIKEFSGGLSNPSVIMNRIEALRGSLDSLPLSANQKTIVGRACAALLDGSRPSDEPFFLRKFVQEEIARLPDRDLGRYLAYRFRYDVFPKTRELDDFPPCVQIEPTSMCNYRCVFCYQVDRSFSQKSRGHMGSMRIEMFRDIIDQLEGNVEAVTLASRGEPLMCQDIEEMLAYASGKFLGLKLNTNGWFLTEAMSHAILSADFNTVVFSVDAADPELYAKLRVNGKFEKVQRNIETFARVRRQHYPESRVVARVSGVKYSSDQKFDEIEKYWQDLVDQVSFVQYNPSHSPGEGGVYSDSAYAAERNLVTQFCSELWRRMFVWWNGVVNPCEIDYKSTLAVGSLGRNTLSEIWTGPAYQALRQLHSAGERRCATPCDRCVTV